MEGNAPPAGSILGERYRVVRRLGKGAYGRVLEVEHVHTLQRLALKLLRDDLWQHPEVVERFMREASAASRIGDEHIVKTFDAGRFANGAPYVAMELLEGESVRAVLDRERQVSVGLATELVAQAAEGIHAAHLAGIVHRDLKPDNLFVISTAGGPLVKVLDFGASRFALGDDAPSLTRTKEALGTPLYMAPEAFHGVKGLGPTLDVYALGAMLYELLCGSPPFDAATLGELVSAIQTASLRPLAERAFGIDARLDAVVARALAKDPAERFQTAAELADAVRPWRRRVELPPPARAATPPPVTAVPSTVVPSRKPRALWLVLAAALAGSLAVGLAIVVRHPTPARTKVAEEALTERPLLAMGMPVAVLRGSAGPDDWRSSLAAEVLTRDLREGSFTSFLPQEDVEAHQVAQSLFPNDGLSAEQLDQVRRALGAGIVMNVTLSSVGATRQLMARTYPFGSAIASVHQVTVSGDDLDTAALELRGALEPKLQLEELSPAATAMLRDMAPALPEAYERYATGRLRFFQGRLAEAEGALARAVELDPHLVIADDTLATIAGLRARPAEEERWSAAAMAAIAKGPKVPKPIAAMANCRRAVIEGGEPFACEGLTLVSPESSEAWRLLMKGKLARRDYSAVELTYGRMPERMRNDPGMRALRCEALQRASSPVYQLICQANH